MALVEKDVVPDFIIRMAIRGLLAKRLAESKGRVSVARGPARPPSCRASRPSAPPRNAPPPTHPPTAQKTTGELWEEKEAFVEELKSLPIAINTDDANEQHYEVPTEYFRLCLGRRLKYSSCVYDRRGMALDDAEEAMLALCCERAGIEDGHDILELGCGWGSLSLYMAERYPRSRVVAVSNSRTQKELIDGRAREGGIRNLEVVTADVVHFETDRRFDRVVSVEMFEHMKNYGLLLAKVARWLRSGGRLFVHHFSHKEVCYHFEDNGEDDWMTRHFFSGGTMPSHDMLLHFQADLRVVRSWWINGGHYSLTLEEWLRRQDRHKREVLALFEQTYPEGQAVKWMVYWRLFYLACSELFAYNGGEEWGVTHVVLEKP